jgi:hypothetical protein
MADSCALPKKSSQRQAPADVHACVTDSLDDEMKMSALVTQIREPSFGLPIRANRRFLRVHAMSFPGVALVHLLVKHGQAADRSAAVAIGKSLVKANHIHHVSDAGDFSDSQQLFRFRADDATADAETASSLTTRCDTQSGLLKEKGFLVWRERFYLLQMSDSKFFCFDDEFQSKARYTLDLSAGGFQVADKGTGGYFSLTSADGTNFNFQAGSSKEQEEWVRLLIDAGAAFSKGPIESTAQTVCEFTPMDIDKHEHPLRQYEGKVVIVVNVASF